jgi:methionyl-tRNA formyltransferase
MPRLRLAFMGSADFSVPSLEALLDAGHEVAAVYCQPPRPAGRGHHLRLSPVHRLAEFRGIPVRTPKTLRAPDVQESFTGLDLDAAVVAAYGLILPAPILAAPRLGCLNVHASLLPRWRGAAPIQRAILAGDTETGVTIMQVDQGLDTGPMLLADAVPITPDTTTEMLHDTLATLGARLIVTALDGVADGRLTPRPQPADGVTYAHKLDLDVVSEPTRGTFALNISPSAEYQLNKRLSLRVFTDYRRTIPKNSLGFPRTDVNGGVVVRFQLQ